MQAFLLLLSVLCFGFAIVWKMAKPNFGPVLSDVSNRRLCYFNILLAAFMFSIIFYIGSHFSCTDYTERISNWGMVVQPVVEPVITETERCKVECRPQGSEALPKDIVQTTSNFELRPLWGFPKVNPTNLLAMPVGIRQKENVNQIAKKFSSSNFTIMLFHYDDMVNAWKDFPWSKSAIHVSAPNQTKWWFAKRFLHPDIVSEYDYIFLWDEDLGVEHFDPTRYLSIIQEEGLHISQPALAPHSEVHHQITVLENNTKVHRRTDKTMGRKVCNKEINTPPCTGWVEMMAPVFSKEAWRCTWYMIQNDLIHAWGLDYNLGYCAQGDRSKNVGVVDSEFVFHGGVPTLGGENKKGVPNNTSVRFNVRRHSSVELDMFKRRWQRAVRNDKCWNDPYA